MLDPDASPLRVAPSRLAALLVAVLGPLLLAAPLALGSPAGAASPVASPVASPAAAAGPAPYGVPAVALDDEETGAPLTVRIDGVTPDVGVLAAGSVVTVTGTITNASEDTWSDLQVFPVTSRSPLTTTAELDEAAATDPLEFVGERLLVDGLFDESITSLPPGESRPYRLDLPVEQLQIDGTPGVYWLAVHALGADADGVRSGNALGRARTFLPLLDPARAAGTSARAGVVVPLRHPVRYAEDGSIADPESWSLLLGREGRLRRIVDLLAPDPTGATGAVSLLLDPALLDVARRLAEGNPPRSLAPTSTATGPTEEPGTAGTDDPTPTDAPTESPIGRDEGELEVADGPVAEAAAAWLEDVLAAASAGDLLVLPYGDVDLGAAATHDPIAYGRARLLADDALARYGLTGTPAVAPRGEGLPDGIVDAVEEGALVLVGDDRLPEDAPEELSAGAPLAEADGRDVVVVDDALAEGGPSPGERTTGLAVRQRLASALVVDALADGAGVTEQHALLLPALWDPADGGSPTDGLTTGWLRSVPVTELGDTVDADPTEIALADVAGPIDTSAALPDDLFVMSRALVTRGARLDSILPETDAVRPQTERAAATLLSYQHRGDLARVRSGARDQVHQLQGLLGRVTVEAPPTVTLSGDDGDFNVRVVNGLDQPVVIRLRGDESQRVTLEPSGPVEVPAGGSANVRMTVEMHRIGVFDVDVRVVDETDTALGGAVVVPVRSAAVSDIIWAVMGGSFVVLVGATLWWYRRRPQQQQRISTPASVAAASRPEDADEPGETDPGEDAR